MYPFIIQKVYYSFPIPSHAQLSTKMQNGWEGVKTTHNIWFVGEFHLGNLKRLLSTSHLSISSVWFLSLISQS